MTKYPYTIEPETGGTFFVEFLDFPNGITQGYSMEHAREMAKEMITGLVSVMKDDGVELPVASAVGTLDFVEVST